MDARLRDLGARDIKVSVTGGDIHVSARVSGDDVRRDRSLVGAAGVISFRPVDCMAPPYSPTADPGRTTTLPACGAAYLLNRVDAQTPGVVKPDPAFTFYPSTTPVQADRDVNGPVLVPTDPASLLDHTRLLLGPTELSGSDVAGATAMGVNGRWSVNLDFTGRGAARLDEFEHENFHRTIGVDLDGAVLVTAPIEPNQAVFSSADGSFTFGGHFSVGQAIDLDVLLNHGPLPTPVKLLSATTVGAGLQQGPN
jgi:preprotein translocase subunit SecD